MKSRVVSITRAVGLADVGPDARMRLDAIARVVQDAADHDLATADMPGNGIWILRKLRMDITRTPRFRAEVRASTWCSGIGLRWAERRTDIAVGDQDCVSTSAIWVHTDPETGAPTALPANFSDVWGDGGGRRVSARLQHGKPPVDAPESPWHVRGVDIDIIDHVNNAAYWAVAEEALMQRGRPRVNRAEIEFRAGLAYGDPVMVRAAEHDDGFALWLTVSGDVRASMLIGCAP